MVDIKAVRDLTRLMRDNDLVELEVESQDLKVRLAKAKPQDVVVQAAAAVAPAPIAAAPVAAAPAAAADAAPVEATEDLSNCKEIISPVPGTAYLKANPDAAPYINVGDSVADGQVVCLVEAMKVFNEIKSEGVAGKVKKICVEDGQSVEYGTVLFLVE